MKKSVFTTVMAAVFAFMAMTPVFAGSLDTLTAPGATNSYTLDSIWNRLNNGTPGTQSTFTGPPSGTIGVTGHTLDEVMAKAPAVDNTNGATAGDVMNNKTFWGLNTATGVWGLQTGTGTIATVPAPVPKTGAAADTTGVSFPNPRFTINAACTVTDNLTGLMWLKDAMLANTVIPKYDPDSTGNGRVQWSNANALVAALNTGTAPFAGKNCGYNDWRLPTVRELHSLIYFGYYNPALSDTVGTAKWTAGNPFDNAQAGVYWSATAYAMVPTSAFTVDMDSGNVSQLDKSNTRQVWPVRGGQ